MSLFAASIDRAFHMSPAPDIEPVDHTRLRLLLVDDHVIVREGIRAVLEEQDDLSVVGECGSGDEALEVAAKLAPDIVLLDLNMPGISPVDTIKGLRSRLPA